MELRIQLEKPSDIQRKLVITVPVPSVQNQFEKQWTEAQKKAHIKGFRKGKVPMNIVKQYFTSDVRSKVLQSLLEESYWNAIEKEKLKPLGQPHIHGEKDEPIDVQEDKEFTFVATFEVFPEIKLGKYTGFSLKSQDAQVKEEEFEALLKNYQDGKAQLIPISEDKSKNYVVQTGDHVDIKFQGQIVLESGEYKQDPSLNGNRLVEIGKGELVPGFEDQLIGMKRGESKTFKVTMPTPFYSKELEGKTVEFSVDLLEIKLKELPELNDDLAKEYQFESLDELKKTVKQNLEERKKQEAEAALKGQLLEQLVSNNELEVPASMVQSQAKALADEQVQYFKQQGFPEPAINEFLKKEWSNIEKRAQFQVKAGLLLDAVSKKESLEVTEEDFDAEMKKMSESIGLEEEKVREYYGKGQQKENLKYKLKEDKAVQFLISQCKIK